MHYIYKPLTKTNLSRDRKQCTESNVLTARLPVLGRLAETWETDWLNTNKRTRTGISGIKLLNTIDYKLNTKYRLGLCWMRHLQHKLLYQQWLTLESWYTNSEQEPLNQCQQPPAPYKQLTHDLKRNWHTSTNNRQIKTTTDQSLQRSITSRQNWPIQITTRGILNTIIWWQLFTWLWRWLLLR